MANLEEITAKFANLDVPTTSKFRDENKQNKVTVTRVSTLKKERKKKSKLLFLTEIALDFNPMTGKDDEQYNRDCKYRPAIATETMMLNLKALANEKEETKKALLRKSGMDVSEWDTSNAEVLNDLDRKVFAKHRYPSIYTIPACQVRIDSFTGNQFGRDYKVEVKRDPQSGQIVGEEPLLLQANRFFKMLAREEYDAIEERNKKTKEFTADELKDQWRRIHDRTVLVGPDRPVNYAIAIEVPITATTEISSDFILSGWDSSDFINHMVLVKITSKIKTALDNFTNGTYKRSNLYDNFYEIDMYCTDDENKRELGRNTTFEKASTYIGEHKDFENFNEALVEFLDSDNNLEGVFLASNFISTFTDDLETGLCDAIAAIVPEDDERITSKVLTACSEIASKIYPETLFVKHDIGMLNEGSADASAVIAEESALAAAAYGDFAKADDKEFDEF